MAIRKFVFLDPTTGQYKEQTTVDSINVEAGTDAKSAVNLGQLESAQSSLAADIAAEQARAEAAEATLTSNLANEVTRATQAEQTLTANLNSEIARATAAEQSLASDLAAEEARALAAEAAEAAARAAAVSAEQTRAEAAEASLVADLNTEISDRQAAVSAEAAARAAAVTAEETRALAAEAALQAEIDAEEAARAAAVTAEAAARVAAVSAEQTRAEAAEAAIAADLATETSNRISAVSAEQARAEAAESGLDARLDVLEGDDATVNSVRYLIAQAQSSLSADIAAEEAARIAADTALLASLNNEISTRTSEINGLSADISAEEARATAAEGVLQANIDAEAAARVAADNAHTASINNEVSRAQAAEAVLTADLAAEVSRASAAEAAIAADLATETTNRIAGDASTLAEAKLYADGLSTGLKFKDSVRIALPTQFEMGGSTLNMPADFADVVGETDLVAGDRLLLISPDENTGVIASGIYVVAAGGVSIVRSSDMKIGDDASGAYVYVEEGDFTPGSSAKGVGTAYVCSSTKGSDIVGSGALKWAIFSRMENLTFGHGFSKSGQNVDLDLAAAGALKIDGAMKLSIKIGDTGHIDSDANGLKLKGALVGGSASNADGEHNHAAVVFMAGFGAAVGTFVKMDGQNAGYNGQEILGFVRATFNGESEVVVSGVVSKAAASFAAGDTLYLNAAGDGFVAFGDVPGGKYAIPVGKKIDGTKILVQVGAPILKA